MRLDLRFRHLEVMEIFLLTSTPVQKHYALSFSPIFALMAHVYGKIDETERDIDSFIRGE